MIKKEMITDADGKLDINKLVALLTELEHRDVKLSDQIKELQDPSIPK